jgi:hypothetical protein
MYAPLSSPSTFLCTFSSGSKMALRVLLGVGGEEGIGAETQINTKTSR